MDIKNIAEIIKDNKVCFSYYRAAVVYYNVWYKKIAYQFPVRLDDVGDATLMNEDKAIMFMRYIRKAIENNEFVRA